MEFECAELMAWRTRAPILVLSTCAFVRAEATPTTARRLSFSTVDENLYAAEESE